MKSWIIGRGVPVYLLAGAVILAAATLVLAHKFAPPAPVPPTEAVRKEIDAKVDKLSKQVHQLKVHGVNDPRLAELEIYLKAAKWMVKHNEFYHKETGAWTLEALDSGLLRASQVAQGETPWMAITGYPVIRAYRSRVDDSVQPYAVTFPADYGKSRSKKWRLDVVLHGRDPALSEIKFLHAFNGERPAPKDQSWVQIDIFGRGNNAYRWAGATDVFEAVDHFLAVEHMLGRDDLLDPARVVLRGFSMGGAGTWHLGLHHPDRWCVLGPGAGFTATRGYVEDKELGKLSATQEACLHIYDAVDYAENAFNVPVVAYAGTKDPQLQAATNILTRLKETRLKLPHPVELLRGSGLGHQFPSEWQAKVEKAYTPHIRRGREEYPPRVHFVTYTMRYPSCSWVEILGLERHYRRTLVDAERTRNGFTVKTANVRSLHLTLPLESPQEVAVNIDGQGVTARAWQSRNVTLNIYLRKRAGRWAAVRPQTLATERARQLQKVTRVQGPIDDAFVDNFLCVRGTGEPWHAATQKYAEANLKRFTEEWSKYMRGDLPVKDDVDVNDKDIAGKNLILFGDPASNSLIADVLDDLPLKWTRETVTLAGKEYDASEHVPVLIYPSPLNPQRYVVLNSGHTFHAADFNETNALLYPRLGDYAVLKLAATEKDPLATTVAASGLYDDFWQIGKK